MNNKDKLLLKFGAIQTILMALYHFFLPIQFGWGQFLSDDIPTINWALFALNNYFSFNLLIVSSFLFYYLKNKSEKTETIKVLSLITLLFWCFSVIYQLIKPMPLPSSLSWLAFVLPGLALVNVTIFLVPLRSIVTSTKALTHQKNL